VNLSNEVSLERRSSPTSRNLREVLLNKISVFEGETFINSIKRDEVRVLNLITSALIINNAY
jgi:hypothetical protein